MHFYLTDAGCKYLAAPYIGLGMRYAKLPVEAHTLVKETFQLAEVVKNSGSIVTQHGAGHMMQVGHALCVVLHKGAGICFEEVVYILNGGRGTIHNLTFHVRESTALSCLVNRHKNIFSKNYADNKRGNDNFELQNQQQLKTLLDSTRMNITLQRLAHQLVENHLSFADTAIVGIQPRGIFLSDRIAAMVKKISGNKKIDYGHLDITFYRDDVHTSNIQVPQNTNINFSIEDRNVILVDDVLYTGRTIRSAMDALIDFGRPKKVELLTLIDRRFSRELPVQPDYVGFAVDTILTQKVKVYWKEKDDKDEVVLIDKEK
jgi:pyrimidine operon attenuation protein/uracil phosphoribosyltransferase